MAGGDGCINGWSVNKGGSGGGHVVDSIWGNTGCWLVCWLLGGLPMQSKYRQHLGKTFGCLVCLLLVGYPPFLFNSPSFGCCVGWFSLLDLSVAWVWRRHIQ